MLAMLVATGLLVAACCFLGQGVALACGLREWQWWAPAVGYAVLMIIFGQGVHTAPHLTVLLVVALVATLACVAWPAVRRAVRTAAFDITLLGGALILLAAIPFFAAGYAGILGASVSNDMSQHLATTWWLHHTHAQLPVAAIGGDLIRSGYPLGPHGLAAALTDVGLGEVRGFGALSLAVPAASAFCVLGLVRGAPRPARWALGAAVGLGYLPAAYLLAQGSFKEAILALFVLATAVVLAGLRERPGWRDALPLAVIIGGSIYSYSYGGLLWIGAVIAVFAAAEVVRRRELFAVARDWWRAAAGAAVLLVLVVLPEIGRIRDFRQSIFGQEALHNKGNLAHALNPFEALGVWFNGDFRFNPVPRWPTALFTALALLALVASFAWWWRRRSLALPAAVLAAVAVWLQLRHTVNIYNQAKGIVVLAPLVAACLGTPLALAWSGRTATRPGWLVRAVGAVLFAGAVVASGGVLRSAPVGLGSHDQEFAQIRDVVRGKPVLFVDNDHFAQWELRGAAPLYTSNTLYAPKRLPQHPQKQGGIPVDIDNFGSPDLDKVDFIVISNGRYTSEIPPNFALVLRTQSYNLYRRNGPTPLREPIEPESRPGAVFDCSNERGKARLSAYAWAGVLPQPVVRRTWRGSIARPGDSARMTVTLPRGSWDLSLQYLSRTPLTVTAPGLDKRLAANFGLITSFWDAGTLTSDGRPLTVTVKADERTAFAQLLGQERPMRAALSPYYRPLLGAAFTRHGETPRRTPVRAACGHYVDWLAPAGSDMRGRSDDLR